MSKFGWDYPAGCSSVPGDEPDGPEACPVCDADNMNDEGEWTCLDAKGFCSSACQAKYLSHTGADAEAEAQYLRELDVQEAAFNKIMEEMPE